MSDQRPEEELPPGHRRLEIAFHPYIQVSGYLLDANRLMDEHEIPAGERAELRLKLIDLLAARNISAVPTNEALDEAKEQQRAQQRAMNVFGGLPPGGIIKQ
jgi:hypothetical protein